MAEFVLNHEAAMRLGAFSTLLVGLALWEMLMPCRPLRSSKPPRWVLPCLRRRRVGGCSIISIPWAGLRSCSRFWRWILPSIYNTSCSTPYRRCGGCLECTTRTLDFDVTTGVRFHPIEIVLSMLIKFAVIAALGTPASAVLIFEVLLSATSLFNHSNVRLPQWLERALRWLVVTPYMHRVHHSVEAPETNRNFGFNLPWWDRLFGTYREQPRAGHQGMTLGILRF
jgi:hypothetical protein